MVDIPNSAKSRLRQGGGELSAHPDANLLAAFSEQALAGTEREQVLAHLAQCADCREVVALSAPEAPLPQTAYVPRGWFGMRPEFMRWAVVGASAAVVVAAVLLVRPELERESLQMARTESAAAVPSKPADAIASQAAPEKKDSEKGVMVAGARRERQAMKIDGLDSSDGPMGASAIAAAPTAPPPPAQKPEQEYRYAAAPVTGQAAGGAAGSGGGSKVAAAQTRDEKVGGLQVMEHPAANPMTAENESQGRAMALAKEKDAARADSLADAQAKKNEPAPAVTELKAQRAPAAETTSSRMMTMRPAKSVVTRTWRITDGKLESSRDGGVTWSRVDVPGGARFMTVDARPSSVWVGGTSGAVFRSPDGGVTWIEVKHGWKGDVVYLKFENEKRGVVRTSAKEEWFTEDGGEVWKKR